jgi:hypothetical protein
MSNEVNTRLIERAQERAQELGMGFYIKKVDKLIKDNDLEALRELLSHMEGLDDGYAD